MNLLDEQTQKNQQAKGKKLVLTLLIVLIILLIISLVAIYIIKSNENKKLSLAINGNNVEIKENMIISNDKGIRYISLRQLAKNINYDFREGGYLETTQNKVNKNKCYLEIDNQIIEFKKDSNKIYKTYNDNNDIDYEYYDLKNNIIYFNEELYIALDDLNIGTNVVYHFDKDKNRIELNTTQNLYKIYLGELAKQKLELSSNVNNKKALAYGRFVVTNKNEKVGVVRVVNSNNLEFKIECKYDTMKFDEYSQNFIVSLNDKYGIVSKDGNIIQEARYDSIQIINHQPLLYRVKLNDKYGILNEYGNTIGKIEYDKIGYKPTSNVVKSALVVDKLTEDNLTGIVVCKQEKYGIINMETGEMIAECELDKIYSKDTDIGEEKYYIELKQNEIELDRYIEYINTIRVDN